VTVFDTGSQSVNLLKFKNGLKTKPNISSRMGEDEITCTYLGYLHEDGTFEPIALLYCIGDSDSEGTGGGGGYGSGPMGGGGTTTIVSKPSEELKNKSIAAKNLLDNSIVKSQKQLLTATVSTDANEKGFSFGKDSNGNYKTTDIRIGANGSSVGILATSPGITLMGGGHTHTKEVYNAPSPGDIYAFNTANGANSSFEYYYTFAADGTAYMFTIRDLAKFNTFVTTYSMAANFDPVTQNWKEGSGIMSDFETVKTTFLNQGKSEDEAFDNATAFVISKYDMGIAMSKQDANGDFKPLFVKETKDATDPTKNNYEVTPDCNL
jgi:hypothetical protein